MEVLFVRVCDRPLLKEALFMAILSAFVAQQTRSIKYVYVLSSTNKKFIENCEDITHNNIPVDIAELPRRRSWLKESRGWPVSKSRSRGVKEYL